MTENIVRFPSLPFVELSYLADKPLDDEQIEAFVAALPAADVAAFTLAAERVKKQAAVAQRMAESRIVGEGILTIGEVWESPDGREFFWTGDRRREVADPAGLKAALWEIAEGAGTLALRAFQAAFKPQPDKVYLSELDRLAKHASEAEGVIRSFTEWKSGPPHLRAVEEGPRE